MRYRDKISKALAAAVKKGNASAKKSWRRKLPDTPAQKYTLTPPRR